jgi:hypothetical protein
MRGQEQPGADGRVEAVSDGRITGWAWDPSDADRRVGVGVWVDGELVAEAAAASEAPGLAEIGIGDGRHAFTLELPEALADGRDHDITVRAGRDDTVLPLVPGWQVAGTGIWAGTTFTAVEPGAERIRRESFSFPEDDDVAAADQGLTAALAGADGWLYGLGEADRHRLLGPAAVDRGSAIDVGLSVQAHLDALGAVAHALDELAVRLVVAVVPAKLAIHPEHAPPGAQPADDDRPARLLEGLARDHDHLEVLDLAGPLRDARVHGPLFHQRDDALNARGAFAVHRALLKAAGVRGLRPLPLDRCVLAESLRATPRGLEGLPVLDRPAGAVADAPDLVDLPPALEADAATLKARRMPAGPHLEIGGLAAPRVYERPDAPGLPRALLLGSDAAIMPLIPWLAETTSRLVVLRTVRPPLEQLELELPDLVLYVIDERLLAVTPPAGDPVADHGAAEVPATNDADADAPIPEPTPGRGFRFRPGRRASRRGRSPSP